MNTRRHPRGSRFFFAFVALLLLSACQLAGGSAQTDGSQVANGYLNAIQGGPALALISPHAVLHTPEGSFAGIDGTARFGEKLDASFDNVLFATNSSRTVGEYLLIEFTLFAIHSGDYHGIEPNCAGIVVPGVAIVHVGLSGITEQWISYDQNQVLNQIHVFGNLDSNTSSSCENRGFDDSEPSPIWAPGCLAANRCDEPY